MVQPLFFPFLSLTPSDPICLPSNSSAPTLKHTVREQPPDPLIMPQTDPLQVQVEWTCFFPKPVAYDSGILPPPFSLGRWTQTGPRPLNILPPIISPCGLKISRHHGNFSTCRPPDVQLCSSVEVVGKPWNKPEGPGPVGTV